MRVTSSAWEPRELTTAAMIPKATILSKVLLRRCHPSYRYNNVIRDRRCNTRLKRLYRFALLQQFNFETLL
jgi:hypothetical protein